MTIRSMRVYWSGRTQSVWLLSRILQLRDLSRTYVMTLYVLLGMAVAIVSMANSERGQDIGSDARALRGGLEFRR